MKLRKSPSSMRVAILARWSGLIGFLSEGDLGSTAHWLVSLCRYVCASSPRPERRQGGSRPRPVVRARTRERISAQFHLSDWILIDRDFGAGICRPYYKQSGTYPSLITFARRGRARGGTASFSFVLYDLLKVISDDVRWLVVGEIGSDDAELLSCKNPFRTRSCGGCRFFLNFKRPRNVQLIQ